MSFLKEFSRKAQTTKISKLILTVTSPIYGPVLRLTASPPDLSDFTFVLAHFAKLMTRSNLTIKLK